MYIMFTYIGVVDLESMYVNMPVPLVVSGSLISVHVSSPSTTVAGIPSKRLQRSFFDLKLSQFQPDKAWLGTGTAFRSMAGEMVGEMCKVLFEESSSL